MIPTEENDAFVIVDMLNDFIDGALANPIAKAAVKPTVRFIESFRGRKILVLKDTHPKNYAATFEGRHLPVAHCIQGTPGADVNPAIQKALDAFRTRGGSVCEIPKNYLMLNPADVPDLRLGKSGRLFLGGTCTEICVVNNALLLHRIFPDTEMIVLRDLCAALDAKGEESAFHVMRACQITGVESER